MTASNRAVRVDAWDTQDVVDLTTTGWPQQRSPKGQ